MVHPLPPPQWEDRGGDEDSSTTVACPGGDRGLSLNRQVPLVPVQTVITLSKLVSGPALHQLVHFMYTGTIFCRDCRLPYAELGELRQAAEFLELSELQVYASNLLHQEQFLNGAVEMQYLQVRSSLDWVQYLQGKSRPMHRVQFFAGDW